MRSLLMLCLSAALASVTVRSDASRMSTQVSGVELTDKEGTVKTMREGDSVMRKGLRAEIVRFDHSLQPPSLVVRMPNGDEVDTEASLVTFAVQAGKSGAEPSRQRVAAVPVQPGMRAVLVNSRPGRERDVFLGTEVVVEGPANPPVQRGKRVWMVNLPKRFNERSGHWGSGRYELPVDENMLAVYPPISAGATVRLSDRAAAKIAKAAGKKVKHTAQVVTRAGPDDGWLVRLTFADGTTGKAELHAGQLRALAWHPDLPNTELSRAIEAEKAQRKQERKQEQVRRAKSEQQKALGVRVGGYDDRYRQRDAASQRWIRETNELAKQHMRLIESSNSDDMYEDVWTGRVDLDKLNAKMGDW